MQKLIITESKRKNEIAHHEGYIYNRESKKEKTIIRWRCIDRKCGGCILTDQTHKILSNKEHNHSPTIEKSQMMIATNQIKKDAIHKNKNIAEVFTSQTKNMENKTLILMPKYSSLRDKITNIRNNELGIGKVNYDELPDFLKNTCRGCKFLRYDNCNDENRVMIFYSDISASFLEKSKVLIMDGTFKCVPSPYTQLYSIHGIVFGKSYPLLFALMKSKNEISYKELFTFLMKNIKIKPTYVITDFEAAVFSSLKKTINPMFLHSCVFHFGQCIWRKLQKLNLSEKYKSNKKINLAIRCFLNLTFVPRSCLEIELNKILNYLEGDFILDDLKEFIFYFQRTYIGFVTDSGVYEFPLFAIEIWSSYERVLNDIPRTTNSVENWHGSMNKKFQTPHPNIGKFISALQKEEELVRVELVRCTNGLLSYRRFDYEKELKLKVIVQNYHNFSDMGYFFALNNVYGWIFE